MSSTSVCLYVSEACVAILGEVALDTLCAEGVRGNVDGDAKVVSREGDGLDTVLVECVQPVDLKHADIREGHRVARGAVVDDEATLGLAGLLEELDDILDL